MKNFLLQNWFKVGILVILLWVMTLLSTDGIMIDVCHKEPGGAFPSLGKKDCK